MQTIQKGPYTVAVPETAEPGSPVVVLLGWAGATDRPLSKFSEALAEHGFISLRCVQPVSYLFSPFEVIRRRWAVALLGALEELGLTPPRPIILYAFSNGGGTVVEQVQKLAETNSRYAHLRQCVAGFVFDSAPGYFHDYMTMRVLETTMPPGLARVAAKAAVRASSWVLPLSDRRQEYWENMLRAGWGKPQLFLYSQDDPLCDSAKLAELIEEKRQRGQRVAAHHWEHSEHVGHLKRHREEYLEHLLRFLRACQAGGSDSQDGGSGVGEGAPAVRPLSKL